MCGRYGLVDPQSVGDHWQAHLDLPELHPRYNAAPSQMLPVITEHEGTRQVELMKWGLVPSWAKDRTHPVINARAEGMQDKPMFRGPFRRYRCLVPASYFFEWQVTAHGKQPYLIHPTDQDLFAFAGIYDLHHDPAGEVLRSFAIVTTEPNALMTSIHNRMPVLLRREVEAHWLNPASSALDLQLLLGPYPDELMEAYPVSALVNNPSNDAAALIERLR